MGEDRQRQEAERLAQERFSAGSGAADARALLARSAVAVLATQSQRRPGWPAASLVPLATGRDGAPLLLLSDLAQHTRNLEADPRVCLFVFDGAAAERDPRTAPRLAVYGKAAPVPEAAGEDDRERYLARFPSSRGLLGLDFRLYRVAVEEAQWVGGFAAAGWLGPADLAGAGQ